jgi:hypothetical protein
LTQLERRPQKKKEDDLKKWGKNGRRPQKKNKMKNNLNIFFEELE